MIFYIWYNHRHTEIINFKGVIYQERLDSDFEVSYMNENINDLQYELFEKRIEHDF